MESRPVKTIPIHDHLRGKLCDLYENDCIFDKFECNWGGDDKCVSLFCPIWITFDFLYLTRHVLTGSYHNFFRIFDTETTGDVVLQADKSAFKAKKIGGPLPNKNGIKNGRPGGLRDAMQMETLDFTKKILHASWHPRENTIAVSAILYHADRMLTCHRLLQRTTCSSIARHELLARSVHHALPLPSVENNGFLVDARPRTRKHMHHTLVPRRQSNHPSLRLFTKHYGPRFSP